MSTPTSDHEHTHCTDKHRAGVFDYPHCDWCGIRLEPAGEVWCWSCDQPARFKVAVGPAEWQYSCGAHPIESPFGPVPM